MVANVDTQTENLLSTHPLMMLYICIKFCESNSKGFRATDLLNNRVNIRVVANVDARQIDGHMDTCMNGWKTGSLYRARQAQQFKETRGETIRLNFRGETTRGKTQRAR